MVLHKLSSGLQGVIDRVRGSGVVDKQTVKEVVKEIQKTLISADVKIDHVFDISKTIEEKALKERLPPGISRKEHLIKVIYYEIARLMGGKEARFELDPKKQNKIVLVGVQGSGKCVSPDTYIPLADGTISTAEEIYEKYKGKEEETEDGFITEPQDELGVYSMSDELKIKEKEATHLWKLKAHDKQYKIHLDGGNGFFVETTPEHPFFLLGGGGRIIQRRADELGVGDYVACPSKIPALNKTRHIDLFSLPDDIKIFVYSKKLIPLLYKKSIERFGTLKNAHKRLQIRESYCIFTSSWRRENKVPLHVLQKFIEEFNYPKEKALAEIDKIRAGCMGTATKTLKFTSAFNEMWAEFLGLVLSDGNIDKHHVSFYVDSKNQELINHYNTLCENLFGILPNITKSRGIFRLEISNIALVQILHHILGVPLQQRFGVPLQQKARTFKLPQIISSSKPAVISQFIRAYVECDGHISKKKREIEISTSSEAFMRQLQLLLLKLGLPSSITTKIFKGHKYHRVRISGSPALTLFKKNIGTITSKRARELDEALKGNFFFEKRSLIPIKGETLQIIRKAIGKSRSEVVKNLSKSRSSLLRYELNTVGVYKALLKELVDLYGDYSFDGGVDLDNLRKLASSELSWVKVTGVTAENPKSKWVYDFTVKDTHNFIANGVIVHNTTQAAKLAKYLTKKGFKPGLVCADKFRPGALDQLKQLGGEINVPVYGEPDEKKPWKIAKNGLEHFKERNVVIIDSEGRHSLDRELMDEIEHLERDVKPDYTLLVLDSTIGQQAETQANAFKEKCNVNGIILTKLDGSAKGGGGISACAAVGAPVFFIGVGERIGDLERFDPKAFVGRLMGFGDVAGLLEKFEEHVEMEDAEETAKRMMAGKFTLIDVYQQLEQVRGMGPLTKVVEMLPGFGGAKLPKEMLNVQEENLKKFKPIMQSMTSHELENPKLSRARVERIAEGSGTKPEDVRALIQQYNQMRATFKKLRKDRRFARMFKGMGDGGIPNLPT